MLVPIGGRCDEVRSCGGILGQPAVSNAEDATLGLTTRRLSRVEYKVRLPFPHEHISKA